MAKELNKITPELKEFIEKQNIFFVGTTANEGRINISPKGADSAYNYMFLRLFLVP